MSVRFLLDLPQLRAAGRRAGIVSICSAHPLVIEAALAHGRDQNHPVLIEATCNQVNQDGGYTGMRPAEFRSFVEAIAAKVRFPSERLILGGDHLGPNPWKHLPPGEAMAKARVMIADFARAGFTKLHLDTSMGCLGEPLALPDKLTANRAAMLAEAAEGALEATAERPVYIIGTEVPVPGGALEALDRLDVTDPTSARATVAVHEEAFVRRGLQSAFARVIGLVVQPGVEFSNEDVVIYAPERAATLSAALGLMPQLVFEAHSTDYQPKKALAQLVADGFAILKVGPALTSAMREAAYGLDRIAIELGLIAPEETLSATMEALMLREPEHWQKYYHGTGVGLRLQRHFSYSDRIRYYWPRPEAVRAVDRLFAALGEKPIPMPLISQYLAGLPASRSDYQGPRYARALIISAIEQKIQLYEDALALA